MTLLTKVWGYDYYVDKRTVDVHARWLREKIEEDPSNPRRIVTVRGVGYRLKASESCPKLWKTNRKSCLKNLRAGAGTSAVAANAVAQETALQHLREEISQREELLAVLRRSLEHDELLASTYAEEDQPEEYKIALALTLSNAAYDALLVVDEYTRILASNVSAESLFGNPRPRGRLLVDVTELPELEFMVMDALSNEEESFEEQLVFRKRFIRVRTQVIRREGNLFIGLALQDVSELVRLNRARRDMVANISHELRTPIANIRLIIDSLFHEQEKPKRKQSTSVVRAIAQNPTCCSGWCRSYSTFL